MDDPGSASSGFQALHSIWSALLTAFGALIFWNGRRLFTAIDGKADKDDLDEHKEAVKDRFSEMQDSLNRMIDNQVTQHSQNTIRLDTILREVYRDKNGN